MKRLIVLLSLIMLFSFGFALPWAVRNNEWQTFAATSIDVDETLTFAVTWGEGGWDADGSNLGYGTSTDGSGWTWVAIDWRADDGGNKKCSTTVTFDTPGTYYYVFRMDKVANGGTSYASGNDTWEENSNTITDKISTEFFKVTVTEPSPTAITLASFVAHADQGKVELAWTTATETENDHFNIYRDGEVIATIAGNGTCSAPHDYSYTDATVEAGKVYEYMISDVSWGGLETVHAPVNVELEEEILLGNFVMNKAYPNPFNPTTVITMHYAVGSNTVVNIYNTQGVLVDQLMNGFVEAGSHNLTWDASNTPSGVYLVTMQAGNTVQSQKIVLMK